MPTVTTLNRRRDTRKIGLFSLSLAMTLAFFGAGPAFSQSPPRPAAPPGAAKPPKDMAPDEAQRLYEEHQRQLQKAREERQALSDENDALSAERARLKAEMLEQARQVKEAEAELSRIEPRILALRAEEQEKRIELNARRDELTEILLVLQRMGRDPPPVMVTEPDDALKMVRSGMLLSDLFRQIQPKVDELNKKLNEIEELAKELEDSLDRQQLLVSELERRRRELEPLMAERTEKARQNQARMEELTREATRHSEAMAALNAMLGRLDAAVAAETSLGQYEMELKSGDVELKPEAKKVAYLQPGRLKPAVPFAQSKGLLPLPAVGVRVRNFGARNPYGGASSGIAIETRDNALVTSPCDGWIVYAGPLRSYGQVLIINAGGGYHILLTGMREIRAAIGQFVLTGEPVAVMGSQAAPVEGGGPSGKPTLYIEFRKDQRPIDPDPWWSRG
jgi:septal ring factor EnvC (AmiA/AmiB activator)